MNHCNCFLKTLLLIYLFSLIIYYVFLSFNKNTEAFIDLGIMKKCNKIKRQCKAKMTILKNGAVRPINRNIQKAYNNIKSIGKKMMFPKEIKISF